MPEYATTPAPMRLVSQLSSALQHERPQGAQPMELAFHASLFGEAALCPHPASELAYALLAARRSIHAQAVPVAPHPASARSRRTPCWTDASLGARRFSAA
jgi:hypothetical protein